MPTTRSMKTLTGGAVRPVLLALFLLGTMLASVMGSTVALAQSAATPTAINIAESAKMTNARRFGVNLGTQDYWDSGQMMRQIMFRNPGFEQEHWQSILHCKFVTSNSCTDDNFYTGWPADFLKGAQVEFIIGGAVGTTATVTGMTIANQAAGTGVTVTMSGLTIPPSVGDYLVARLDHPGDAQLGWWTSVSTGASLSTEFSDLSPNSPGKQALRVTVPAGGSASVSSYTDGYANHSFLQLTGTYTLTFRAKSVGGTNNMNVTVKRNVLAPPGLVYLNQNVALTTSWQDYSLTFQANDTGRFGTIQLSFAMNGASVLLDDVALTAPAAANNPTNFRNEVVDTLLKLKPGTLRYQDAVNWGSTIDNLIAVDFARQPSGYSNFNTSSDQIPIGLHDFMQLCTTVNAEPWFTIPTGMSAQEMTNLMEYFAGPATSPYGAKRAALGQFAPWTTVFKTIHLEFGNEVWNTANPGAGMDDPVPYGQRSGIIFTAGVNSPYYVAKSFDFIADGFEVNPGWNQLVIANSSNLNTIDVATYIFDSFSDASSTEAIFGSMFAEPEWLVDTPAGWMNQHAAVVAASSKPVNLAVYETNISPGGGSATQDQVNAAVPSAGAGITEALNLLLAQRDLGVNDQNVYSLTGFQFPFTPTVSGAATTSPIWSTVVDMGGQSNLQRPNFLGEQLANTGILPTLLSTSQSGANPTWNQPLSPNNGVALPNAHYIQTFAYTDGTTLNVIAFNLSRTTALPITLTGLNAPTGAATFSTMSGNGIMANNETSEGVSITTTSATLQAGAPISLPPYSMTLISAAAPYIPAKITAMSLTCARSSLSPSESTSCTPSVVGQGKYNSGVTWSVDQGAISNSGVYTAPGAVPANGVANVTITSIQDTTKTASFAISVAPNTVTAVTISCGAKTLGQGLNTNCTASVSGTGSFSNAYAWSLSGGSITPAGLLTAALTGTSMTVTATSVQDTTKSASTTVALTPVLTVTNPILVTTATSVTASWTINSPAHNGVGYGIVGGTTAGTPYDSSLITNPSYVLSGLTPGATYNLWLTSYTNTQSASKLLTVTLPKTNPSVAVIGVAVSCGASTVFQGGSTSCAATVAGTGAFAKTVNWSASGGSITSAGVLTVPTTGTAVTVTATSTQDTTKSGNFAIALNPVLAITTPVLSTTSTTITASWTDSTAARNGIGYGIAGGTTTGTPYDGSFITNPSYTLTGLTPGATYNLVLTAYTSTQSTTKLVTVTLPQAPATKGYVGKVNIVCTDNKLVVGTTTACRGWTLGSNNQSQAVTYTTLAGTISSTGVLTAPATGATVQVKATSVQDPTKSATFTIALASQLLITNPVITTTSTSITASWTTNVSAHNGVQYGIAGGTTTGTPYDGSFTTSPSYNLTGLTPGATYTLWLTSYKDSVNVVQKMRVTVPK